MIDGGGTLNNDLILLRLIDVGIRVLCVKFIQLEGKLFYFLFHLSFLSFQGQHATLVLSYDKMRFFGGFLLPFYLPLKFVNFLIFLRYLVF